MAVEGDNPYLPPEILINILKRLRVKSLLRFRAVCKDWRNLLKSPSFIEEHYHHSAHNNPLLIFHKYGHTHYTRIYCYLCLLRYKLETVEVERIPEMDSLRRARGIMHSCNGLLCLTLDHGKEFLLLNPATRELKQVPRTTKGDSMGYGAFELGFGFSPVVRDYKIVRIYPKMWRESYAMYVDTVEVYSLRTGSWKEIEFDSIQDIRFKPKPVTVNGAIFWLGEGIGVGDQRRIIVSFDIEREVFTLIPRPSLTNHTYYYLEALDVYENKVAMLHGCIADESSAFIDLWVLEEGSGAYGKNWGWTKRYSIGPTLYWLRPICFWRNQIVCKKIQHGWNGKLVDEIYHLFSLATDNELKKFPISMSVFQLSGIFYYAESLVSMCDMHVE